MSADYGPKVQVVQEYGAASRGVMDPKRLMTTDKGRIHAITTGVDHVEVSGVGVGTTTPYFPGELQVLYSHATGVWSFPSGDGSLQHSHSGVYTNALPPAPARPSATIMLPSQTTSSFSR